MSRDTDAFQMAVGLRSAFLSFGLLLIVGLAVLFGDAYVSVTNIGWIGWANVVLGTLGLVLTGFAGVVQS